MTAIFRLLAVLTLLLPGLVRGADPVEFSVGEFAFERPEGWAWVAAASPMRKAQLAVQGPDGEQGEVVFFHFGPGMGGTVEANVQRWLAQFQGEKPGSSKREEIGGRGVTFVGAEGTFLSGMPGTQPIPMEGFGLRGAILESPDGDVYVKFTGPVDLVAAQAEAFDQMVRGAAAR